jgi:hypothetical protein
LFGGSLVPGGWSCVGLFGFSRREDVIAFYLLYKEIL